MQAMSFYKIFGYPSGLGRPGRAQRGTCAAQEALLWGRRCIRLSCRGALPQVRTLYSPCLMGLLKLRTKIAKMPADRQGRQRPT